MIIKFYFITFVHIINLNIVAFRILFNTGVKVAISEVLCQKC